MNVSVMLSSRRALHQQWRRCLSSAGPGAASRQKISINHIAGSWRTVDNSMTGG
jgi:hypothetical protein